jgi:hypothetical protein
MKPMSDMHLSAFWDGCVGRKSPSALYAEGHLFYSSSSELVETKVYRTDSL